MSSVIAVPLLFFHLALGAGAANSQPDVTIDVFKPFKCSPPLSALKAGISGEALFHLELQRSSTEVIASVVSVKPDPLYAAWAACVARKWVEFFPDARATFTAPHDVTVHFNVLPAEDIQSNRLPGAP